MSSSDQIKDLIRSGKKDGYILESILEESISHMSATDQTYIRNTILGFKIQIIESKKITMSLNIFQVPTLLNFFRT